MDRDWNWNPLRQVIDGNAKADRVAAWSVVVFFATWLSIGLAPLAVAFFKPEAAGQFGDMFGAVNSLFSGLAFIGVALAIAIQMQEIRHNEESQSKQIAISQISSRIQAFTFLADLQYRLMQNAPPKYQAPFKRTAQYCMARAARLMADIDEGFPGFNVADITDSIQLDCEYARAVMGDILFDFIKATSGQNKDAPSNLAARAAIRQLLIGLDDWKARFRNLIDTLRIDVVSDVCTELQGILFRPADSLPDSDRSKYQWETFWQTFPGIQDQLERLYSELDELCKRHSG